METKHIFDNIEDGMLVVQESDKEKVGTVEFIRYGEGDGAVELPGIDTITEMLAEALHVDSNYPDEVYEKLYAEGFIRVERGLEPDVYVFPSQIAHVANGEVHISITEDELLKE